jgi:hypothetical protein
MHFGKILFGNRLPVGFFTLDKLRASLFTFQLLAYSLVKKMGRINSTSRKLPISSPLPNLKD